MSLYPAGALGQGQQADRTMDQIEALQMQIGELEREANKQSSAGAGLEHRCQQEADEVEALGKAIEMSDGEAVRKKEKLQELVEQKERAQRQTGEIISSKAELDTIYLEAQKHRDLASESMRKLRSEYGERLQKSSKLQETAKALKRRIPGGIENNPVDGPPAEKHQKLRDANAKLESELVEDAAAAADKAQRFQLQVDEADKLNHVLEQKLGENRLEITKFQMLVKVQESELDRLRFTLQEHAEFRDGIHRDYNAIKVFLQKAEMLHGGVA